MRVWQWRGKQTWLRHLNRVDIMNACIRPCNWAMWRKTYENEFVFRNFLEFLCDGILNKILIKSIRWTFQIHWTFFAISKWLMSSHPFKSSIAMVFNFVFAFDAKIVRLPNRCYRGRFASTRKANGKRRTAINLMEVNNFFFRSRSIYFCISLGSIGCLKLRKF